MKRNYLIVMMAVVASFVAACKDDDPAPSVVGFWTGIYTYGSLDYNFHMLFRPNGTLTLFDGTDTATADRAEGTYFVADSVKCTFVYPGPVQYSAALKMNDAGNTLTGTYGSGVNTTGTGTINLSR